MAVDIEAILKQVLSQVRSMHQTLARRATDFKRIECVFERQQRVIGALLARIDFVETAHRAELDALREALEARVRAPDEPHRMH